ncbi:MAG: hypothetical protein ACOC56_02595 [Atribacterota bacterium]
MYNLLNCRGWETGTGWVASIPCLKARLGIVILFFGFAVLQKWGGEEIGLNFSIIFASLFGLGGYFLIITLFGTLPFAFIIGILGGILGGYGGGIMGGY